MRVNRSMPNSGAIPELAYPDPRAAAVWLEEAFGFTGRLRIGNHRIQMRTASGGDLVVTEARPGAPTAGVDHGVMVRVEDADALHARATAAGAVTAGEPQDYPFGERQFAALDPFGHRWTFSQTIADVDPAEWGGEAG